jgi:hypothetical protein
VEVARSGEYEARKNKRDSLPFGVTIRDGVWDFPEEERGMIGHFEDLANHDSGDSVGKTVMSSMLSYQSRHATIDTPRNHTHRRSLKVFRGCRILQETKNHPGARTTTSPTLCNLVPRVVFICMYVIFTVSRRRTKRQTNRNFYGP